MAVKTRQMLQREEEDDIRRADEIKKLRHATASCLELYVEMRREEALKEAKAERRKHDMQCLLAWLCVIVFAIHVYRTLTHT